MLLERAFRIQVNTNFFLSCYKQKCSRIWWNILKIYSCFLSKTPRFLIAAPVPAVGGDEGSPCVRRPEEDFRDLNLSVSTILPWQSISRWTHTYAGSQHAPEILLAWPQPPQCYGYGYTHEYAGWLLRFCRLERWSSCLHRVAVWMRLSSIRFPVGDAIRKGLGGTAASCQF